MFPKLTSILTPALLLLLLLLLTTSTTLAAPFNTTELDARDSMVHHKAGLTLLAFTGPSCTGIETLIPVTYNEQMTGILRSYKLSRDMKDGEVFDFSTGPGKTWSTQGFGNEKKKRDYWQPGDDYTVPSQCTTWDQTAEPLTKGKTCWTLNKDINCARFWHR